MQLIKNIGSNEKQDFSGCTSGTTSKRVGILMATPTTSFGNSKVISTYPILSSCPLNFKKIIKSYNRLIREMLIIKCHSCDLGPRIQKTTAANAGYIDYSCTLRIDKSFGQLGRWSLSLFLVKLKMLAHCGNVGHLSAPVTVCPLTGTELVVDWVFFWPIWYLVLNFFLFSATKVGLAHFHTEALCDHLLHTWSSN